MTRIRAVTAKRGGSRIWALVLAFGLVAIQVLGGPLDPASAATPPAFRSASTAAATSSSLSFSVPVGTIADDMMLTQLTVSAGSATVTAPAGWTYLRDDGGSDLRQHLYYRVASSSEPASYTWTFSAIDRTTGATASYSGVDPVTPIHNHSGDSTGNGSNIDAPSLTTTISDVRLVGFFGHGSSGNINPPGSMGGAMGDFFGRHH